MPQPTPFPARPPYTPPVLERLGPYSSVTAAPGSVCIGGCVRLGPLDPFQNELDDLF